MSHRFLEICERDQCSATDLLSPYLKNPIVYAAANYMSVLLNVSSYLVRVVYSEKCEVNSSNLSLPRWRRMSNFLSVFVVHHIIPHRCHKSSKQDKNLLLYLN